MIRLNPKLLIPFLVLGALITGQAANPKHPALERFGFPGSSVSIVIQNPDPAAWKPLDLGNKPRPDMLSISLRHVGIRDFKNIDVHPVISVVAWKFPDDRMDLEHFSDYLLKQNPFPITKREIKDGRLLVHGTSDYGGYTHIIRRAFYFRNRVGIDLICDSTDSVFPQVEQAFEAWIRTAALEPLIKPLPVRLANPPKAGAEDEARETTTHLMEKQTPNASEIGDIAGIKDEGGMTLFWNRSQPYFKLRVEGHAFVGYGRERAMFTADDVLLQVQSTELTDFCPDRSLTDPTAILLAHRDWEFRYLQEVAGVNCALRSWTGRLADGSPVIYWDATPEKVPEGGAIKHVFCTRYHAGAVIVVSSVETQTVSLERAENLVFYAISNVEFSKEKFDIKGFQQRMAAGKP